MNNNKILELTRSGNPILGEVMPNPTQEKIRTKEVQKLIADICYTNQKKQYGVGSAAPQVGVRLALSVIGIKPTPARPDLEIFDQVIINPKYKGIGRQTSMWEGCQSVGSGNDILYGKAWRYRKTNAEWFDETGKFHEETLNGIQAHVLQHETDHLNGILFVDRVRDTRSYMMADEYRKRIVKRKK